MKILFQDTIALIIKRVDENYNMFCVTEYQKDGSWMNGINTIISIEDILKTAEENKLYIIFENRFDNGEIK